MISLILGIILVIVGLFCFIKPDNFLLPFASFYYNPKKPVKPMILKGGYGAQHIKEFGKTKGILLYMRIFGIVAFIIGILFLLSYFEVI
jgi:uncharacterized membrane protein YkgB